MRKGHVRKFRLLNYVGEGKGGVVWENSAEMCILPYVKEMSRASSTHEAGHSKLVLWDNPEGWGGEGSGRGIQDGGTHVHPWLTPVNVWQKPPQYYKVVKVKVAQSCPTLCDPMDYTVHGILLARKLEWVAFPFSRGSSQPRDQTQVSLIAARFFTSWATREAHCKVIILQLK